MNFQTVSAAVTNRIGLPLAALIAAATICHAPAHAQADPKGSYVGLGAGQGSYKWRNPTPAANGSLCGFSNLTLCRDSPVGFKGFIGYNVTRFWGVEAMYFNAGKATIEYDQTFLVSLGPPVVTTVGRVSDRVILSGFGVSAVGTLPVGPAFISGRIGMTTTTASTKKEVFGQSTLQDRSRGRATLGVGAGANFWRQLGVRLDWDRVSGENSGGAKFEADLITLNLIYRFE